MQSWWIGCRLAHLLLSTSLKEEKIQRGEGERRKKREGRMRKEDHENERSMGRG